MPQVAHFEKLFFVLEVTFKMEIRLVYIEGNEFKDTKNHKLQS